MKLFVLTIVLSLIVNSCTVGPKYRAPAPCMPDTFVENRECGMQEVADTDFFEWWRQFNDETLNEVLEEAARDNFDIRIAVEKIRQARATFFVELSGLFPQLDFDAVVTRTKNSSSLRSLDNVVGSTSFGNKMQNFFLLGFDAVWQIDLFGKLHHSKNAAFFDWRATSEDAKAVQLLLLSEAAMNYCTIRALQNEMQLAYEFVEVNNEALTLMQDRFCSGLSSQNELINAQDQLYSAEAQLEKLHISLHQAIYRLAVLLGRVPETMSEKFQTVEPIPSMGSKVPVSLPSDLLRRRPDIRSAEQQIRAANERTGVAVADLFPQFSLTSTNLFGARDISSNFGFASNHVGDLLKKSSVTWSVGVAAFLPLIDFGKRMATIDVQSSQERQAYLNYGKIVVEALEEVESALTAYFQEQQRFAILSEQLQADFDRLQLQRDLWTSGLNDYLQVIEATKTWIATKNSWFESNRLVASNLIALYKALGGEWQCLYLP